MIRHGVLAVIVCLVLLSGETLPAANTDAPYKQMAADENAFLGVENHSLASGISSLVIGLLSPGEDHPLGKIVITAASTVINEANRSGGYDGKNFSLARRWSDSPWKDSSGEILKLAYNDQAIAIITTSSLTGHLATQIAAKAYVPIISVAASDETLNQARVPWIFRLPAGDDEQADSLLTRCNEIGDCHAGILSSIDPDSRIAGKAITGEFLRHGVPPLFHFQINSNRVNWPEIIDRIQRFPTANALFLRTSPEAVADFIQEASSMEFCLPLYLPWIPSLDLRALETTYCGDVVAAFPFSDNAPVQHDSPQTSMISSPLYALTADGVQMIINGIHNGATTRTSLQRYLSTLDQYNGKSGFFRFTGSGSSTLRAIVLEH